MKQVILSVVALAAFVVISCQAESARADSPFLGPGYNGFGGGGCLVGNYYGLYGLGQLPIPPYYAIHPPVYYSAPVARPYGYSPYALPPGMLPAETHAAPQPEEIRNPYVEEETEAEPASTEGRVASGPQWIVNPFVEHADRSEQPQLADIEHGSVR